MRVQVILTTETLIGMEKTPIRPFKFGDMAMGIQKAEYEEIKVLFENINPH